MLLLELGQPLWGAAFTNECDGGLNGEVGGEVAAVFCQPLLIRPLSRWPRFNNLCMMNPMSENEAAS